MLCGDTRNRTTINRLPDVISGNRFFLLLVFLFSCHLQAAPLDGSISRPVVAIILDDLGNTLDTGKQAIELPYPLTYSFLPHSPHLSYLTKLASQNEKEIMLHLPMEPNGNEAMGPGGLLSGMHRQMFLKTLRENMATVPNFVGVNNHMGSRLTRSPASMRWLMQELKKYEDVFFVDSFTTLSTVAYKTAVDNNIPALRRDVFLDHDRDFGKLDYYFNRLIRIAKQRGYAVAIGHPHPQTLAYLRRALPHLRDAGIQLVTASQLIEFRKRRENLWRASLSPSPAALKN